MKAVCEVEVVEPTSISTQKLRCAAIVIVDGSHELYLQWVRKVNDEVPVVVLVSDKNDAGKFIEDGADDTVRIDLIPYMLRHTLWSASERRKAKIETDTFIREERQRVRVYKRA